MCPCGPIRAGFATTYFAGWAVLVSLLVTPVSVQAQEGVPDSSTTFEEFMMLVSDDPELLSLDENGNADVDDAKTDTPETASSGVPDPMELPPGSSTSFDSSESIGGETELQQFSYGPIVDASGTQPDGPLTIADVIASVYRSYPDIARARQESAIAGGEVLSARGAYDTKFQAHSLYEPMGFYNTNRNGLGVARQTWWGGYVAAGYRIGRGFYQPWYKERQTDDAGEFKFSFAQPLLQGRAIDPQRVALFQASLARQAAQPIVQQTILEVSRDAMRLYWQWVSAGGVLQAQRELLALAKERGDQLKVGVKAGRLPPIDLVLNRQLVAERQAKAIDSEQKFRAVSFKLSLFLRDDLGRPMVPQDEWLPENFPIINPTPTRNFNDDFASALARRPEPQVYQFKLRQVQLDRQLACNEMLPRLDLITEMSQDMGEPATKSDDKGEFELLFGITSEVPIQRRKARGKIQSTSAKIQQINEDIRLMRNKIGAELQTAYNALQQSYRGVKQDELALRAALETLDSYRFAFEKGKIDLIYLNLLEVKATEIEIKLVEAQKSWFAALADLQLALGLDPLDQAMIVASLPPSDLVGPGNLPEPTPPIDVFSDPSILGLDGDGENGNEKVDPDQADADN